MSNNFEFPGRVVDLVHEVIWRQNQINNRAEAIRRDQAILEENKRDLTECRSKLLAISDEIPSYWGTKHLFQANEKMYIFDSDAEFVENLVAEVTIIKKG